MHERLFEHKQTCVAHWEEPSQTPLCFVSFQFLCAQGFVCNLLLAHFTLCICFGWKCKVLHTNETLFSAMCSPLNTVKMFKGCLDNIIALLSKLWIMEFSIRCRWIKRAVSSNKKAYVTAQNITSSKHNIKAEAGISSHFIDKDHRRCNYSRITSISFMLCPHFAWCVEFSQIVKQCLIYSSLILVECLQGGASHC